ncbi:MAG: hypothetical protein ACRERV_04530 [Methylococcales bacterium]
MLTHNHQSENTELMCDWIHKAQNRLLTGRRGSGKTVSAGALGQQA